MNTLHLFPDTNVFIQCNGLESLDWSLCGDFDEVLLIVCRPVQREIDGQKNRGSDRIGRRSRRAHALFREAILSEVGERIVRPQSPRVTLRLDPQHSPTPGLAYLDYEKADDALVACVHAYKMSHPEAQVRLLTHDSGPMWTSRMLGVPFMPVPDAWLAKPEPNEAEQEANELRRQLQRLQKQEPQFSIRCEDTNGKSTDKIDKTITQYRPLTDSEVDALEEALRRAVPIATQFVTHPPTAPGR